MSNYKPNSPQWLIAANLAAKRTLIRARLDDIERAQSAIKEAEAEIAEYERALALLNGEAQP
jgi:hypothetical protein